MKTDIHFWSYVVQFFLEWEMFQTKVVEKIKTHILCSVTFFRKSYRLWDNVEKCGRAGQSTDDNMAHAHCVLNNYGYRLTLRICNYYCFSTATLFTRTCLNVTFIRTLRVVLFGGNISCRACACGRKTCGLAEWRSETIKCHVAKREGEMYGTQ